MHLILLCLVQTTHISKLQKQTHQSNRNLAEVLQQKFPDKELLKDKMKIEVHHHFAPNQLYMRRNTVKPKNESQFLLSRLLPATWVLICTTKFNQRWSLDSKEWKDFWLNVKYFVTFVRLIVVYARATFTLAVFSVTTEFTIHVVRFVVLLVADFIVAVYLVFVTDVNVQSVKWTETKQSL